MGENEQDMLNLPRRKACKDNTACASRAHINLTTAKLELKSEIEINILVKKYPWDVIEMHIPADMWNDIRALGVDDYRTLAQVVSEQFEVELLSQAAKSTFKISFSRSTYVSGI